MAKKKSAKKAPKKRSVKKKGSVKKRPPKMAPKKVTNKRAQASKAAPKKKPVKKKKAVAKKPAKKAMPKKKVAAKKKVATKPRTTKPAAVEAPPLAPVQTALILFEPVPSLVETSQQQSSLIGEPIAGKGSEVSSTLLMRPMTESQPLDKVEEASEESFPASDSPTITQMKPR
jgi:hypothetical protein